MINKIYVWIIFVFVCNCYAQQNVNNNILEQGIEASYKFQLKKADSLFYSIIEKSPESPLGYHYLSQLHLWYYLGSRDEAELIIYEKYSELAQERLEDSLSNDDENAELHFLSGQIYLFRALADVFRDEKLNALFSSRNAKSEFEETLDIDSTYYDAYYGIGILNYVLSYVPSGFQWIISLSGLDADKEEGLNNLRKAVQKGDLLKTEAAFHLAQVYSDYSADYDSSLQLLNRLTNNYPNNIIFNYEKAVVLIKAKKLRDAEISLLRLSKINYKQFSQTNALILFQLGNVYFFQNRFDEAIKYYNQFFDNTNSMDFTGIANFRKAVSYYMLNREMDSKHALLLAGQGNLDIELDKYAKEQSIKLFDSWLRWEDKMLIIARNNLSAGNYIEVIDSLKGSINKLNSKDLSNTARLLISDAYLNLDSLDSAIFNLKNISIDDIEEDNSIIPYSELLVAQYYYSIQNYEKSQEYLDLAMENNEYGVSEFISAKIVNLQRKLSRDLVK